MFRAWAVELFWRSGQLEDRENILRTRKKLIQFLQFERLSFSSWTESQNLSARAHLTEEK